MRFPCPSNLRTVCEWFSRPEEWKQMSSLIKTCSSVSVREMPSQTASQLTSAETLAFCSSLFSNSSASSVRCSATVDISLRKWAQSAFIFRASAALSLQFLAASRNAAVSFWRTAVFCSNRSTEFQWNKEKILKSISTHSIPPISADRKASFLAIPAETGGSRLSWSAPLRFPAPVSCSPILDPVDAKKRATWVVRSQLEELRVGLVIQSHSIEINYKKQVHMVVEGDILSSHKKTFEKRGLIFEIRYKFQGI